MFSSAKSDMFFCFWHVEATNSTYSPHPLFALHSYPSDKPRFTNPALMFKSNSMHYFTKCPFEIAGSNDRPSGFKRGDLRELYIAICCFPPAYSRFASLGKSPYLPLYGDITRFAKDGVIIRRLQCPN